MLPLVQRTGTEVLRHPAAQQRRMQGTERDSDGETKDNRNKSELHAAALVLQGNPAGRHHSSA